jgi:chemotaxis protein methyltransferase WspC
MSARIAELLKHEMGLDVATIGPNALDGAIRSRLAARGLRDEAQYWSLLQASPQELKELIEAVVVPETSFFRHSESFEALQKFALERVSALPASRVLRVLSVPCSSGEEPYSIVMALLDAGIPATTFEVEGVDISTSVLELAREGAYGRNSFRGQELPFRSKYFETTAEGFRLRQDVKRRVRFLQGNLLDTQFLLGNDPYDFIFCRNVLIYFDAPTQAKVVGTLDKFLLKDGFLFVGPSEAFLLRQCGYVQTREARSFSFRRAASTTQDVSRIAKPGIAPGTALRTNRPPVKASALKATGTAKPATQPPPNPGKKPDLESAQRLADEGRLDEAARICQAYLAEHGPTAVAHYLFAVLLDAQGKTPQAEEQYRKVIYLDPDHAEALRHLELLAAQKGDIAGAQRFQSRAERAERAGSA